MTYARSTTVSATRTRNEIEETLERYGADGFAYDTQGNLATPSMWGLHPCRPGPSGTTQLSKSRENVRLSVQQKCHIHRMENVALNPKEQAKLQVLNSLRDEHMILDQAAELMGVSHSPHQAHAGRLP